MSKPRVRSLPVKGVSQLLGRLPDHNGATLPQTGDTSENFGCSNKGVSAVAKNALPSIVAEHASVLRMELKKKKRN